MNRKYFARRLLILCLLPMVLFSLLTGCDGEEIPAPTASPVATERPVRLPADNEKPVVTELDSQYAGLKIYDKFGAWPAKQGDEYYSSDVGTWFTIWWTQEGEDTFDHWTNENWTRLKPVDYGYYSSGGRDYLRSVLPRLKYMDIDFILLDDTNGHWADGGALRQNMTRCFKVAEELNGFAPKIAIATGAPLRAGNFAEQQREFDSYYSIYKRYPTYFYRYEEKPLLVMYLAMSPNARMEDSRFTQRYGTGFVSWQDLAEDASLFETQGNWGWVFDRQNEGTEVMGVQPGYNKAHQGENIQSFPRDNGVRYTQMWLAAIKANPKVIMIPSYNDHAEETGWEATTPIRPAISSAAQDVPGEDPYVYEKITEAYLALRYGYIEGFFYQVEDTNQVYQCVAGYLEPVEKTAAAGEPIILIPEGYIEWELNRNRGA